MAREMYWKLPISLLSATTVPEPSMQGWGTVAQPAKRRAGSTRAPSRMRVLVRGFIRKTMARDGILSRELGKEERCRMGHGRKKPVRLWSSYPGVLV
jgi:hypothetical protein